MQLNYFKVYCKIVIVYPGGWDLEGTLKEALKKARGTLALEYQNLKKVSIVLMFFGLGSVRPLMVHRGLTKGRRPTKNSRYFRNSGLVALFIKRLKR